MNTRNRIKYYTPDQAWAVYQLVDHIRDEILEKFKVHIAYFMWQEKRLDDYVQYLEQLSEEELETLGVWLEPEDPDDLVPF